MNYFFKFLGAPGTLVSATFLSDMFASVSTPVHDEETGAIASFRLYATNRSDHFYDPSGNILANGPTKEVRLRLRTGMLRYNTPVDFMVDANAQYGIELLAYAQTETLGLLAEAWIDPSITIAPAQQSSYSLLMSAGVSNLSPSMTAVPEPGSLGLLAAGLSSIMGLRRYRRLNRHSLLPRL